MDNGAISFLHLSLWERSAAKQPGEGSAACNLAEAAEPSPCPSPRGRGNDKREAAP
jgi:hypothetical protein